jgi:hypothetical protein
LGREKLEERGKKKKDIYQRDLVPDPPIVRLRASLEALQHPELKQQMLLRPLHLDDLAAVASCSCCRRQSAAAAVVKALPVTGRTVLSTQSPFSRSIPPAPRAIRPQHLLVKRLLLVRHAAQRFHRHAQSLHLVERVPRQLVEDGEIRLVDLLGRFISGLASVLDK